MRATLRMLLVNGWLRELCPHQSASRTASPEGEALEPTCVNLSSRHILKLTVVQIGIEPAGFDQLVVGALFDNVALAHD